MRLSSVQHAEVPQAPDGEIAVEVSELNYATLDRKGRRIDILQNVDLRVREGEFIAIVGPSGCGKSTLLNIIAGLKPYADGKVKVLGAPAHGIDPDVGYMFQTHALLPWRTVRRNVELPLELTGVPRVERLHRATEILRQMGLAGFEDHYPAEISGGMRQRVSLARTLVAGPRLLLMDEPFGALDAQTKLLIQELFIEYWERHRRTVIFVTHDLAEAISMADRVLVMSARPACFKAEYMVGLPRPRSLADVRSTRQFTEFWDRIWDDLRQEAAVAMMGRAKQ